MKPDAWQSKGELNTFLNKMRTFSESHISRLELASHADFLKLPFVTGIDDRLAKLVPNIGWVIYWCSHGLHVVRAFDDGILVNFLSALDQAYTMNLTGSDIIGPIHLGNIYALTAATIENGIKPQSFRDRIRNCAVGNGCFMNSPNGEVDMR